MEYRLMIFDADGTLRFCTVQGQPCPNSSDQWELYPGVREKLAGFDWAPPGEPGVGYGIASNQGGVGVGYFSEETARHLLEDTVQQAFGVTPAEGTVELCPHIPHTDCGCRKPEPTMLNRIMKVYGVDPGEVLFVGDREDDRNAALNAGCDFMWAWEFFGREPDSR